MKKPAVTICGGGNLCLVCAGVFLSKGFNVNILTGHPANWNKKITVYDQEGKIFGGSINKISNKPEDVVSERDIIFLTLPGYLIEKTLENIKPYLKKSAIVGTVVSSTGFFFMAHEILGNEYTLFGFQRVPYIARQREYGKIGDLLGYKSSLNVAIENCEDKDGIRLCLEEMFSTPVKTLNNFYEASLTNSNPILHTGRLYSMWREFVGTPYERQSLFYSDWTNEASEYLIMMDEEFQKLLRKLKIAEGVIPTLLDYYESNDAESLTNKIKSIEAFKTIKSPMKHVPDGWVPDFSSRYFTEDFPYGLRFIYNLANIHKIPIPTISKVYDWGMKRVANEE